MKWHYNIIKSIAGFYVSEVFYEDGKLEMYSEPISGYYETKAELLKDQHRIFRDCVKSKVINEKDLPRPDLTS